MIISATEISRLGRVLPFWSPLLLVPIAVISTLSGGWLVLLTPLVTWYLFSILDAFSGLNLDNANPDIAENRLGLYRAITAIWPPIQFALIYWMIWYATGPGDAHLAPLETIALFFGLGVVTGTIGINFSHELMHRQNRAERALGDALLAMVLYSHFRSEHLLVHHRHVGTPRDAVTARYNEGFHRFFPRVLRQSLRSAFAAEQGMQQRRGRHWSHPGNPFWQYWALQLYCLILAALIGGWIGMLLFIWQAFIAIWQLELVNYVEHYGLTRRHLGQGEYENVLPRHSWNAAHKATNWLLINLQRHSDHHYKPSRRFPLLQTYDADVAPQLPYGYPVMTTVAMIPPLWRRVMNPRVRAWRRTHYPDITDWTPYNKARNPMPPR